MFRNLFLATMLPAGSTAALAQRTEIMFTGGVTYNTSQLGRGGSFDQAHFNSSFGIKAGRLFPSRTGIGIFYERTHFDAEDKRNLSIIPIGSPQHSLGLEVYQKAFLTSTSYLRFGLFWGYSAARLEGYDNYTVPQWSKGFGYSTGVDIACLFPLARRLSGVVNSGFHYYRVEYNLSVINGNTSTIGFPLTIGLNYKFAGTTGGKSFSEAD